jgi:hypothetical protein
MSPKDLIEDLNHLRVKYGTCNVYKSLMRLLREEYEELSSLFGVSSGNMPSSTFYPTTSTEFYKEYMDVIARAAHDTLEEQHTAPASFYDLETESVNDESNSLEAEDCTLQKEMTLEEEMALIDSIFNDSYSASSDISPAAPVGEPADTPQETPLKIIQTSGASAASEDAPKKKLLKKKPVAESVEVIKETPTKGKKKAT